MSKLAKVSHLVGMHFTVSSGNPARVELIGPGGLRVIFRFEPTDKDIEEADKYLLSKMESNVVCHTMKHGRITKKSKQAEFEDYRKFLNDNG